MAQITSSCRWDGSGWEEVSLGQVTVLPTSSCKTGRMSHIQLKEEVMLRDGDAWPLAIPSCGTWCKPETCSMNAQHH